MNQGKPVNIQAHKHFHFYSGQHLFVQSDT